MTNSLQGIINIAWNIKWSADGEGFQTLEKELEPVIVGFVLNQYLWKQIH